jgi:hypothetical protein
MEWRNLWRFQIVIDWCKAQWTQPKAQNLWRKWLSWINLPHHLLRWFGRWRGDYVVDYVAMVFKNVVLTWQPHGADVAAMWRWRGIHAALTWQPRGTDMAATWRWRGWHMALKWLPCGADVAATWRWREHMQFFPDWISAYINPLQPSPHTFLAQPIFISAQQMPNRFKIGI